MSKSLCSDSKEKQTNSDHLMLRKTGKLNKYRNAIILKQKSNDCLVNEERFCKEENVLKASLFKRKHVLRQSVKTVFSHLC